MDDSAAKAPAEDCRAEKAPRLRLLIADDRTILRQGLRAMLESEADFEIVGGIDEGRDAVRAVGILKPDVVLLDLSMPNMSGLSAIREVKRRCAHTKTLVLTVHASEDCVRAALSAGADGYLLKDASRAELLAAIETVLGGQAFISPAALQNLVGEYRQGPRAASRLEVLTVREKQVLKLIAEGQRNRQMAEQLAISVKTVEKHRSNLMHKLELHNTAALTSFAIENRLTGKSRSARPRR
jgi:DNA-binding NarL/FixJ family response regulator